MTAWYRSPSATAPRGDDRTTDDDGKPFAFSVDQTFNMRSHGGQRAGLYHRSHPADSNAYGTATCSRRIIINTDDRVRSDDASVASLLCRRCFR